MAGLFTTLLVLCALNVILIPDTIYARSFPLLSRQKRISDQMLAEADTRSGLSNVKGMVKTVPVGFGVFNLEQIGRRRRSTINNKLETLKRIMQIINDNPELLDEDNVLSPQVKLKENQSDEYSLI
ncbi:hypothetical protein HZU73_07213 [Apis mellifera caucasica]|uniref:Uncharacterized protein LOC102654968 isoform X1 n=1 Tax=Apis mellifera TaxID=7460 RepID=A0A7M7GXH8_APIME|nr:uncharacterized protein LOC102654968 isoform X1 [Apis mellifera]KAG6797393.1 hypothetical protein HZU73_07213 [Apis mellifera caucasica]KAG9430067.1 hypothetical protein HZU67_08348 [Apis mellifera carnica]|eukprot:XP_006565269.1 uncharacterized protein LOC102654968 isoform X1 [Apis mellifera]